MSQAEEHSQHPISIYLGVWLLLFILSSFSYLTDFMEPGVFRWAVIIILMLLKAGFIVAIFMHLMWERLALITAVLLPPVALFFLIGFMLSEGHYTFGTRVDYMGQPAAAERKHIIHEEEAEH